jgi:hypothetical protein
MLDDDVADALLGHMHHAITREERKALAKLRAALMTLHFAPAEAERTLEELSAKASSGARIILADWRAGRIRPLTMGKVGMD